jgi:hypothetical protein
VLFKNEIFTGDTEALFFFQKKRKVIEEATNNDTNTNINIE